MPTGRPREYVLTVSCPDTVGLVAAVSGLIASWGGWLSEVNTHADPSTGRLFMRNVVLADSLPFGIEEFERRFRPLAERHLMDFAVRGPEAKADPWKARLDLVERFAGASPPPRVRAGRDVND